MKTPKIILDLPRIFVGQNKMKAKRRSGKNKKRTEEAVASSKDATPTQPNQVTVDSKIEDIGLASEKSSPSNESMASSGSYSFVNSTDGSSTTMTNEEVRGNYPRRLSVTRWD